MHGARRALVIKDTGPSVAVLPSQFPSYRPQGELSSSLATILAYVCRQTFSKEANTIHPTLTHPSPLLGSNSFDEVSASGSQSSYQPQYIYPLEPRPVSIPRE